MPFGLKNAGATYQRAMPTLFHDMMHKEIEVYVDDVIAKSKTKEEHVEYLLKLFQCLRKYKLCLNPDKCTFGVHSGKLLGLVVSEQGIEVDPNKVKAIQEMPTPTTEKQMLLSEYDIEYHTQNTIKGSILVDHLAHQPIDDYQSIQFNFPDEDVMYLKAKDCDEPLPSEGPGPESRWGLIFDGVINVYGNGVGAVIVTPQGSHIPFTARLTFTCTNNVAEYEACIMGLEEAIDLRIKILDVYGDSTLIADVLATLSSMIVVNRWNDVPIINVMYLDRPAYAFAAEEVIDGKPWYHDIKCFIQRQRSIHANDLLSECIVGWYLLSE
ncbi:uncharacterized protein LOC127095743 [Lathyrus oleraceus]|uniref:uncharacterized protein LOC127095743 n=1 Tax=Pisum sativum TaxID=3888 RepID=UPI0021D32B3E|nr:uncharacterized protein LOC127095743 [Pisum sativum]